MEFWEVAPPRPKRTGAGICQLIDCCCGVRTAVGVEAWEGALVDGCENGPEKFIGIYENKGGN